MWATLPWELVVNLGQWAGPEGALALARTCRALAPLGRDARLWRALVKPVLSQAILNTLDESTEEPDWKAHYLARRFPPRLSTGGNNDETYAVGQRVLIMPDESICIERGMFCVPSHGEVAPYQHLDTRAAQRWATQSVATRWDGGTFGPPTIHCRPVCVRGHTDTRRFYNAARVPVLDPHGWVQWVEDKQEAQEWVRSPNTRVNHYGNGDVHAFRVEPATVGSDGDQGTTLTLGCEPGWTIDCTAWFRCSPACPDALFAGKTISGCAWTTRTLDMSLVNPKDQRRIIVPLPCDKDADAFGLFYHYILLNHIGWEADVRDAFMLLHGRRCSDSAPLPDMGWIDKAMARNDTPTVGLPRDMRLDHERPWIAQRHCYRSSTSTTTTDGDDDSEQGQSDQKLHSPWRGLRCPPALQTDAADQYSVLSSGTTCSSLEAAQWFDALGAFGLALRDPLSCEPVAPFIDHVAIALGWFNPRWVAEATMRAYGRIMTLCGDGADLIMCHRSNDTMIAVLIAIDLIDAYTDWVASDPARQGRAHRAQERHNAACTQRLRRGEVRPDPDAAWQDPEHEDNRGLPREVTDPLVHFQLARVNDVRVPHPTIEAISAGIGSMPQTSGGRSNTKTEPTNPILFTRARLTRVTFADRTFLRSVFGGATLIECHFERCIFVLCVFVEAHLERCVFDACTLIADTGRVDASTATKSYSIISVLARMGCARVVQCISA